MEAKGRLKGVLLCIHLPTAAAKVCSIFVLFFWQFNRFRFQIRFHFGGGKGKSRRHVDLCACLRPVWTATPTEAALRFLKRRTTSTNGKNRTRRCCCCYWLYWLLHSVTICMQIDLQSNFHVLCYAWTETSKSTHQWVCTSFKCAISQVFFIAMRYMFFANKHAKSTMMYTIFATHYIIICMHIIIKDKFQFICHIKHFSKWKGSNIV